MLLLPRDAQSSGDTENQQIKRIWGENRYETAARISKEDWDEADTVVLARGDDYADALAGVPLAYQLNAPILLTPSSELAAETLEELKRLNAEKAYLLGGEGAISPQVKEEVEELGLQGERLGGENRFQTAVQVAQKLEPADKALLAYGHDFPDALSAAAYAAREGYPLLLNEKDRLHQDTRTKLESYKYALAVGGTAVISEEVLEEIEEKTGIEATRIGGENRYQTSLKLATHFSPGNSLFAATGSDFPDAITGGVLAARQNAGIIMVDDPLPDEVANYFQEHPSEEVSLLGGEAAISNDIKKELDVMIASSETAPDESDQHAKPENAYHNYQITNGTLYGLDHRRRKVLLTDAPSDMPDGDYYADDDLNFFLLDDEEPEYQGNFNYYPEVPYLLTDLRKPVDEAITPAYLDDAIAEMNSGSSLIGQGESYLDSYETWGINPVFLLSLSIHESAFGSSNLALSRNNLFGFRAYDHDPSRYASTFQSFEDSILYIGAYIRRAYLDISGAYYQGPHLKGINEYYATDPMWAAKVSNYMQAITDKANLDTDGGDNSTKRVVGKVDANPVKLRRNPGTGSEAIKELDQGAEIKIEGVDVAGGEHWFLAEASGDTGWLHGKEVEWDEPIKGAVYISRWYKPERKELPLNVRQGPGTSHDVVDQLLFGKQVKVHEMDAINGNIWLRVSYPDSPEEAWVIENNVILHW